MTHCNMSAFREKVTGEKKRLHIHSAAFLLFAAFYIADMVDVYLIALLCAAIHEVGHMLALYACGVRGSRMVVHPYGVELCRRDGWTSYRQDVCIYAMGPLFSLGAGLLSLHLVDMAMPDSFFYFCGINFTLFAINLFPVSQLDGGRIVEALLKQHCDYALAERMMLMISLCAVLMILAAGVLVLVVTGYNISLLAVGGYLLLSLTAEQLGQRWRPVC